MLGSQGRTQRQEATGRTVRRHSAETAEERGHHRPRSRPGHHPSQGAGHPAPADRCELCKDTDGTRCTTSEDSRTCTGRDSRSPRGSSTWPGGGARPSWSAAPATTPSTPGSPHRSSRSNHRRATCGESRMRRSGRGPPEKDPRKRAPRWRPTSTLWHNLAEYAEKTVTRHRGCLKDQTAGETGDQDEPGPADTPGPEQAEAAPVTQDRSLDVCGRERQMARRTRERYAEIRERLDAGQPQAAIRRATGLDRRTVQKYARAASAEELVASMSRDSKLDEFKPYICQRWNQGLTEAAQIHAELAQRGWTGSPQTVRRYVHLLRGQGRPSPPPRPCRKPARSPAGCCPAPPASTTATRPGSPRSGPAAAPGLPGRAHPGLRRHDDPPAGPART